MVISDLVSTLLQAQGQRNSFPQRLRTKVHEEKLKAKFKTVFVGVGFKIRTKFFRLPTTRLRFHIERKRSDLNSLKYLPKSDSSLDSNQLNKGVVFCNNCCIKFLH